MKNQLDKGVLHQFRFGYFFICAKNVVPKLGLFGHRFEFIWPHQDGGHFQTEFNADARAFLHRFYRLEPVRTATCIGTTNILSGSSQGDQAKPSHPSQAGNIL